MGQFFLPFLFLRNLFRIQHTEMVFLVSDYGFSESDYMDSDLFFKWFRGTFIPHCGSARPVFLLLDKHESHISIEVIQLARANTIEIFGFSAYTTHILVFRCVN
jgi:hypothetical protein